MAKKKTKLEKMSKDERTSLAYALATNLAKHGTPQTPKNERKLTKGEEGEKEKHVMKFKDSFDLEEQFSDKHDNNPALKGKQSNLPDALQKSLIKKAGGKVDEGILMALAQQMMKDKEGRALAKNKKKMTAKAMADAAGRAMKAAGKASGSAKKKLMNRAKAARAGASIGALGKKMKKMMGGGKVKAYKKGGSVGSASKRADGIAQRGHTRGRMV